MRRGQLLTLDAMLSLILVVFILATVTNTSSALKEEISSMIEWQERANIAENMLDVLTKSPGEPSNWYLDPTTVVVPGLRSNTSTRVGLDYQKVYTLFHGIETNDSAIIKSLYNLSGKKDFQQAIFLRETTLDAILNYTTCQQGNWSQVCHVKDLVNKLGNPSDQPALIYCPSGEFQFRDDSGQITQYTNNRYMCINSSVGIHNNFHVTTKEYTGINGKLEIKPGGSLNVSDLYLEGDGTLEPNTGITASGDVTVGGHVNIKNNAHVTAGGYGYFYNDVDVENNAHLTIGKDLYVNGKLQVKNNGNLKVGGSAFINGPLGAKGNSHIDIGKELRLNGPLTLESNGEIKTGGNIYINGSADVSGKINSGGGLYINGPMTIESNGNVVVNGDLYVNGKLSVKGTLTVHGSVYVNGEVYIESSGSVTVNGDLHTSDHVGGHKDNLHVNGETYEYESPLPWDESKLHITVNIPPMKHAPCFLSSLGLSVIANVTVNMSYSTAEFYSNWKNLAIINGTLVNNPEVINKSKERSPWIEHEERRIILARTKYEREYNITEFSNPQKLYIGRFVNPLPPQSTLTIRIPKKDGNLTLISVFLKGNTWGYSVITLIEKNSKVYPIGEMTLYTGRTKVTKECDSITVNERSISIPWKCIVPSASYTEPANFLLLLYSVNGFNWVDIADLGSINVYMKPVYSSGKIELWVWDDS